MGIFDGLLILSDMDGTLTHNERLSDENAEAIKYFCRNGGYFSVATGRQPHYIKSFEPKMTPNAPVVALNGTVVFDTKSNKCLYKNPLKDKAGSVIRYAAKNYPKIDTICANMLSDTFEWHKNAPGQPDFDFKNNEIMKILFISFNKDFLIQLKDELTEKFPDFIFLRSWENGLEMLPEGTGKGECIEILKKCLPV